MKLTIRLLIQTALYTFGKYPRWRTRSPNNCSSWGFIWMNSARAIHLFRYLPGGKCYQCNVWNIKETFEIEQAFVRIYTTAKLWHGIAAVIAVNIHHIVGLVQDRPNYGAFAMELRISCINPSIPQTHKTHAMNHERVIWGLWLICYRTLIVITAARYYTNVL